MHSTQFTAIARWADEQGCTVAAMHHLPGAMMDADGAMIILCRDVPQGVGHAYAVVSLHVDRSDRVPSCGYLPEVTELSMGDRDWKSHLKAWDEFTTRVQWDSEDM